MASVPPALWRVRTPREVWAVGVAVDGGVIPGMLMGAKKLAQQEWILVQTAKKFAQQAKIGRFWGALRAQGELFRAWALMEASRASFVALVVPRHG